MIDLNRAQVLGRLTQDPELRQTANGQSVVSFSVATNRSWKDNNSGEQKEQVEFHNIVAWGKLAEIVGNYMKKGKRVFLEGRLQTRSWEDANGMKHWKTEIVAENIIMLDGKASGGGDGDSRGSSREDAQDQPDEPASSKGKQDEDITVEDVPF